MAQHLWGSDFDWKGLDDAGELIGDYCAKWGRFGGQIKEKFGELRFYNQFGLSLHQLIHPTYIYFKHPKFPKWLWDIDCTYISPILSRLKITKLWIRWQEEIYSKAYHLALKKWPHLRAEILCGADNPQLIKGVCKQEKTREKWSSGEEYNNYKLNIMDVDGKTVIGSWSCINPWTDIR